MSCCEGHHHTRLCHMIGVLLCLLFHVHLNSCHQGDPPGNALGNGSVSVELKGESGGLQNTSVADDTLGRVMRDLFIKYGDGEHVTFEAFEHMLENIGLGNLHIHDHDVQKHREQGGSFKEFHADHDHTHGEEGEGETGDTEEPGSGRQGDTDRAKRNTQQQALDLRKCVGTGELLGGFGLEESSVIDENSFLKLCPALVYQLDNKACLESQQGPCKQEDSSHQDHEEEESDVTMEKTEWHSSWTVWGYSFLSVTIISLVGLLSVAVIPLTKKVFYNHLLQFLVALAVGSLTGDACLHLLPHAISPHDHADSSQTSHSHQSHDQESLLESKSAVWKGLAALSGIYFFFLMERVMGIITERKRKRNKIKREQSPPAYKQVRDKETEIGAKLSSHSAKVMSCEEMLMVVHPGKDLRHLAEEVRDQVHEHCDPDDLDSSHVQGHGHGHSHGPLPSSVSSVAWMVIMGDGLHNFSDGLAIGAAFANSLSGGVSTSVAVFCHELPHELGDFAVLLRAGMPAKQAIVYNLLSSVLCLAGMVVGVLVGNLSSASLWIFALIGGMFIYVALVDMLPEMTAVDPKAGEHPLLHLLLQNVGMLTGAGIMLVIAIYEDKIQIPHWEP